MLFNDFVKLAQQKFGEIRLADLARELDVSAQVINGWKLRDKVPYKYVKKLNDTFSTTANKIYRTSEPNNTVEEKIDIKEKKK